MNNENIEAPCNIKEEMMSKIFKRKTSEERKNEDNIGQSLYKNNYNLNEHNKLIDSKDFFFNYRNEEDFNKMNILEVNYKKKNYNFENNEFRYKNNDIKDKELDIQKANNFYDSKNTINSIDSNKMKEILDEEKEIKNQIKYEEKMLNNLRIEKNKLIEAEKKRREMIINKINNNKNEIKEKKEEIQNILIECKKARKKLIINNDNNYQIFGNDYSYNNNNHKIQNNYYKEYQEQIRERNNLINKNCNEIIKNNLSKDNFINKENNISHVKIVNKRHLSKKENQKNEGIYSNYKNNNENKNTYYSYNKYKKINYDYDNNKNLLKINLSTNNLKGNNERNLEKYKINLSSYFQLNDKEKICNYTTSNDINNNKNYESNNYLNKKNYEYLTPKGFYRINNTDNSSTNRVYKSLANNNNNFMTQTRFYRSRLDPDELISHYAKEKIKEISFRKEKNENISISPYPKELYDNYKTNKSASNLMNLIENKSEDYQNNDNMYFNYSNNILKKNMKIMRFNKNRNNIFLGNRNSYSNSRNKIYKDNVNNKLFNLEFDNINFVCNTCSRIRNSSKENLES